MVEVKNKTQLVANGETELCRRARILALETLEHAIAAVNPKAIVASKLTLNGSTLHLEALNFNLEDYGHVYVVGGGKAAAPMAEALEEILGDRITEGVVNAPHGSIGETKRIRINFASHPLPDESGVAGTRRMLEIAEKAQADDLVICLISGGGSSLMSHPREGISVGDLRDLTAALLKSGAPIEEINAVRKHVSSFKGGWLAKKAHPATILNLILSDVVGDPLSVIASAPTVPDPTTFADARAVLERYGLWDSSPASIQEVIRKGEKGDLEETPKPNDAAFEKVFNVVVGNNRTAAQAACSYLRSQKINPLLLTSTLEGEARCVGTVLASIANEVLASANPAAKPVAIVAGGETTVKVTGNGLGGRNQELALSTALRIKAATDSAVVVACLGTDGVDGPTDAAGAIVDSATVSRAEKLGLKPEKFLAENDSYHFFSGLGDLIFTGQTGTNVNDISLIIIL